ncbi:hypothetical protein GGS23DRAFT_543397 [Durotheca rogersii]|uniref:uncharacterized protein n=1 Tax=Durotheca rogersii TaxID=419775 RepID=UPI00221E379D|nr:uncharacterized protein GGS23DRAFT_543397 [Durotheca rogersii]KAI5867967.1 hypothetical protein GGS23DRAFT_543397 [Durotheca rogersii]
MTSSQPSVDLEKELTCSICTEILYQPLTLLDCLHTFCGACLKNWFSWQLKAVENAPTPRSSSSRIYTCPSCRAPVRDTRHNATVNTLLDMFLAANPDKSKPADEKEEMRQNYRPGDDVLPRVRVPERSSEDRRLQEIERQMLEQARQMSLRDAGVDPAEGSRARRRRDRSRSDGERSRSDRDGSRDARREPRDYARRDDTHRRRVDPNGLLLPEPSSDERRRHRSESRHHAPSRDSSRTRRQVEHQASIRSLISSSDVDSRDVEREIEEFARQIQEEGLLDGLDLDNIDLTQNDELSRKITDAYRRRQRDRVRNQQPRRSDPGLPSRPDEHLRSASRPAPLEISRPSSRQRSSSATTRPRSSTAQNHTDDRNRPPVRSTHLEVHVAPERRQRRTSSSSRSATEPVRPRTAEARPAARSQTDLPLRSQGPGTPSHRPSMSESMAAGMPVSGQAGQSSTSSSPRPRDLSFSERTSTAQIPPASSPEAQSDDSAPVHPKKRRPSNLAAPQPPLPSLGLIKSSSSQQAQQQRARSQFYQEPSVTCSRCERRHIEYELHYHCSRCAHGEWNICLNCYRSGKGCRHWFGFGYAAFARWERVREKARAEGEEDPEPSHILTPCRYKPPKYTPGGAEGRRTLTTDDPSKRLESGEFCAQCLAWANDCIWRCLSCNEGEWGFCNSCVNQGKCCTHPLLPLAYVDPVATPHSSPSRAQFSEYPRGGAVSPGLNSISLGDFKPLTFTMSCEICHEEIPPDHQRYHCSRCLSTTAPNAQPGDYNICTDCYAGLVRDGRISNENGHGGWRRCLKGHRMTVIGFSEASSAHRRQVIREMVGGHSLRISPSEDGAPDGAPDEEHEQGPRLEKWSWKGADGERLERLVTVDVAATGPPSETEEFPPDGGVGTRAIARWSWLPQPGADDELLFPRGAEVQEIEDVNGEWFFGHYMGAEGLFPAPYVVALEE